MYEESVLLTGVEEQAVELPGAEVEVQLVAVAGDGVAAGAQVVAEELRPQERRVRRHLL